MLIFSTNFIWDITHSEKIHWDIIVNIHRSSCNILVILVRLQDFLKFLNIKFHKNASSGRQVVTCRWKDGGWTGTQTDMMKLSITFHNLVNVPKNGNIFYSQKSVKQLFQLWQKICLITCVHEILTTLKMCRWEHMTSKPTTIKKNCSISSVRTAPMNHNLVLASPQLFLSPYILSHPWAKTKQSITEGSLFPFFPHYVLQFCWHLWISSNYTGNFLFVPTNRKSCHTFAILRCNRQETLVPEITRKVRDVYLHLPKTQLQVMNYDKYIFVLPIIKYNSYQLLKLLHTAALRCQELHSKGVYWNV